MKRTSRRQFISSAISGGFMAAALSSVPTAAADAKPSVLPVKEDATIRIYIITDLEGAAMVSRWDQTRDATPESAAQARSLLTGEVNAAVDGILDAEPAADVVVWDGHGSGGLDVTAFHPRARLITRGPIKPPYYLDASFAALFFVGQHAMAGTPDAPLCHTYSSKSIEYFKINGKLVGEFGARAIMAGSFGVPTVFISGDDKAVAEAKEVVPSIHGAVTKWGLGIELALHRSPTAAQELIRKMAADAVRDIKSIPPVAVPPPYEQEIRLYEESGVQAYLNRGATRIDERTVCIRSDNICDLHI